MTINFHYWIDFLLAVLCLEECHLDIYIAYMCELWFWKMFYTHSLSPLDVNMRVLRPCSAYKSLRFTINFLTTLSLAGIVSMHNGCHIYFFAQYDENTWEVNRVTFSYFTVLSIIVARSTWQPWTRTIQ